MSAASDLVVYIVDDDASVRKGLSRLIRSAGFQARAFVSAEELLMGVNPDDTGCILLDITMPRMSGLRVAAEFNEKGIDLPIIAVSARDDDQTRELAHELGARFFLRKPVDDQALLDAVSWVVHNDKAVSPRGR